MNINKVRNSIVVALFVAAILAVGYASAATRGDQNPFAAYGRMACNVWDGGSTSLSELPIKGNQNAWAVKNNGFGDGGTAGGIIYLGFDTSLTPSNGFPVDETASLGIDLVSVAQTSAGGVAPKVYCTKVNTNWFPNEVRYILVK